MPRMRPAMRSGWNCSKASSFSPVEAKAIGSADDLLDGQRGAAAGVAVELGQDDAVDLERLVEGLGHGHGVLAGHRVDDEERVVRLRRRRRCWRTCSIISASMARRPAVSTMSDVLPSRRASSRPRLATATDRRCRNGPPRLAEHGTSIWRPSVRSCSTAAGRWRSAPTSSGWRPWPLEPAGQLGRVGGLAGALQAGHQHDRRRAGGVGDLRASRRRAGRSARR